MSFVPLYIRLFDKQKISSSQNLFYSNYTNLYYSYYIILISQIYKTCHGNRLCRLPGLRLYYLSCNSSINKIDAETQLLIVIKLTMKINREKERESR